MVSARPLEQDAKIVVAGAGSIGCFIGGLLALEGRAVSFLGRPRIVGELQAHGLHLTGFGGLDVQLGGDRFSASTDPSILSGADLVLVTVKSGGTVGMAEEIAAHCRPGTTVLSLQNGVGNIAVLREALPEMAVLGGTVEFNVVYKDGGHFHRGTSGGVIVEAGRDDLLPLLTVSNLRVTTTDDLASLHWGKLFLNLNNALNALSGLPLRQELLAPDWRRLLADQTEEALRVVRAAGITPAPLPVPPRFTPFLLRLPTPLFRFAAAPVLKVDPEARSSMWEDLIRRRSTEIDYLQGAVITLGNKHAIDTPLCRAVVELIKQVEERQDGPPGLTADQVRAAVKR